MPAVVLVQSQQQLLRARRVRRAHAIQQRLLPMQAGVLERVRQPRVRYFAVNGRREGVGRDGQVVRGHEGGVKEAQRAHEELPVRTVGQGERAAQSQLQ